MKAEPLNSFCKYCRKKVTEEIEKRKGYHIHCYEAMDPKKELNEKDTNLLKKIEAKIFRKLPVFYNIELTPFDGIIIEERKIVCLGLQNLESAIPPEEIFELEDLKKLSFGMGNLQKIPDSIKKLKKLESLIIVHSRLTELPDIGNYLKNLRVLMLWSNFLGTIPETISKLTNLKKLNVDHNRISLVPDYVGNLTNLEELSLESNKIGYFSETVCSGLISLKKLYLASNAIRYIPEEIKHTKLEYLDLSNQVDLEEVPKGIFGLLNLRVLKLYTEDLKIIPKEIKNLVNLEELIVEDQVEIPEEIFKLKKLKQKIVEYNRPVKGKIWKKAFMLFDLETYQRRNREYYMNIVNEKKLSKYVRRYLETTYFLMPNGYYLVELGRSEIAEAFYVVEGAIDNISNVLVRKHEYWDLLDHYPDRMDNSFDEFEFDLVKDLGNFEKILKESKNLPEEAIKNKEDLIEYLWSKSQSENHDYSGDHYF